MPIPLRSSPASRLAGLILALAAALSAFFVISGGLGLLSTLPGAWLVGAFSWAALFLPLWLGSAALLCFLPGFRPGAVFALIGSLLPFLALATMARLVADPAVLQPIPFLEALGLGTLVIALGLAAILLGLGVAWLVLRLFPEGFGVVAEETNGAAGRASRDNGAESVAMPRRLLAAPGGRLLSVADTEGSEPGPFDFSVPDLPPAPRLTSVELAEGRGAARKPGAEAPPRPIQPETLENGGSGEEGPVAFDPADEPIPLMFGRQAESRAGGQAAVAAGHGATGHGAAGHGAAHVIEFTSVPPGQGGSLPASTPDAAAKAAAASGVVPGAEADVAAAEKAREEAARRVLARKAKKPYAVHVDGLLNTYPDGQYWIIDEKTKRSAEVLQETLAEFNIKAEVTGIRKGPVITMFEILPAPGVRLSKIANLADNIALRLAASSVRIVAPIPGKHAVGIEVPNDRRSIVSLREIVENEAFKTAKMEVPVILGKDIAGEAQFIDLVQTPHLLIAGATGSGKSVSVNSLILSILFRRSPEEVKLILIDPKIVELKLYNDVPHLLTPVITEPKRAFQALQYCICEMERRYSMLDRLGVRDIKSYNRKIKEKGVVQERLPYIVVIIDEFADLMATTGKELESTLARLAAMSRAVGIHLVLATQRPSIDVITGLIKANIPSRIAFMVASKFDSRIIIDMVGAEKLLGRGDMLFASAWDPFPIRMQGAYVSEEEVEKSVEFVKTLGEPEYIDEEIFIDDEEEDEGPSLFDDGDGDPLFEQALEIVLQQGKASASYIQRKLKIGYNRAARIVELMEEKGIVGKAQGSKPRDLVRNPEIAHVRNPEVLGMGGGKPNTPPANRGDLSGARQPSLLAGLETLPGEGIHTGGAAASGAGLEED